MSGNPLGLKKISEDSGVHIVTGTGYYLARVHPPEVSSWTMEHIAETFVEDICSGIGDTGKVQIFGVTSLSAIAGEYSYTHEGPTFMSIF